LTAHIYILYLQVSQKFAIWLHWLAAPGDIPITGQSFTRALQVRFETLPRPTEKIASESGGEQGRLEEGKQS
jgi:hypothetical protein